MEVKSYSLAILGDSGVGKTALAYRIVKNEFMTKETKGGEYFQKISYCRQICCPAAKFVVYFIGANYGNTHVIICLSILC